MRIFTNTRYKKITSKENGTKNYYYSILFKLFITINLFIFYAHISSEVINFPNYFRNRKSYTCPTTGPNWAIITTINYPTDAIRTLASYPDWIVLIVADAKTPKDWYKSDHDLVNRVILLTLEEQLELDFDLIDVIPTGSYARKNIGYLCAITCGAKLIYETDDNNKLVDGYRLKSIDNDTAILLEAIPPTESTKPLVNPYALYGHPEIWPRGFPLQSINQTDTYEFFNVRKPLLPIRATIQQSLVDLDPDVDAIFRLTQPRSIGNIKFQTTPKGIAIASGYFTPFNTQNTLYQEEAFWGLLIPYTKSFRVCDIWRGYWVQRLLWDVGGSLVFRPASVKQIRNAHDYFKDFEEELDLYLDAGKLVDFLASWKSEKVGLFERMLELVEQMADKGFWKDNEVRLMQAWIQDLKRIGYKPPPILDETQKSYMKTMSLGPYKKDKRTALCLSGQLDRISKVWIPTQETLNFIFGPTEYDLFYYISTFKSPHFEDEDFLKDLIKPVYGILYADPPLAPKHSTNSYALRSGFTPNNLFQQLYGLKRCFEMTQKHSIENNITYDYFMRLRTDHILAPLKDIHLKMVWHAVENERKVVIPYDVYELRDFYLKYKEKMNLTGTEAVEILWPDEAIKDWISDRIALGPYDQMMHYMMRYNDMNMPALKTLHAESFLKFILNHYNVSTMRIDWSYDEVPHDKQ